MYTPRKETQSYYQCLMLPIKSSRSSTLFLVWHLPQCCIHPKSAAISQHESRQSFPSTIYINESQISASCSHLGANASQSFSEFTGICFKLQQRRVFSLATSVFTRGTYVSNQPSARLWCHNVSFFPLTITIVGHVTSNPSHFHSLPSWPSHCHYSPIDLKLLTILNPQHQIFMPPQNPAATTLPPKQQIIRHLPQVKYHWVLYLNPMMHQPPIYLRHGYQSPLQRLMDRHWMKWQLSELSQIWESLPDKLDF